MAKLYLKFEQAVLKEIPLSEGEVTIGRLPDNKIQIDNPLVSGHHARVIWEADHYVIEDLHSTNGTYVNNRRIERATLKEGDNVLVGKHTLSYKDVAFEQPAPAAKPVQAVEATMVMTGKQAAMLIQKPEGGPAGATATMSGTAVAPARDRIGVLTVIDGKTDESQYVLTGKLTVIGKSDQATVKLSGWFAPKVAAIVMKRDAKYMIAPQDKGAKVRVNGEDVSGQKELGDSDTVEVAGIKMTFTFQE